MVVITGASSGIGRAIAHEVASGGGAVVVASRDAEALADVVRECTERGGRAIAVTCDVAREQEVQAVARRAVAEFGRIDVWINNAAVALFAKFEDAPPDVYRRVMETNFFGYVHGARAAMHQFRRQTRGILINIDSVTAEAPQPYTSAYVASKYAIRGWSACLRMELSLEHEREIHVCNVMPAAIDTPLFQHAANYTGRAAKALNPTYTAAKVAQAVASLIESPRAEIIVGTAGRALAMQHKHAPRVYERVVARVIDRDHFQKKAAQPTEGNLFQSKGPKAVSGGWTARPSVESAPEQRWAVAVATAAAGAFAVAFALRKLRGDR
ncbi:MAG TPA: SDR family oxidoreductase [Thermoanaerobaculia bacterium]